MTEHRRLTASIAEAAELLGISTATAYNHLVDSGIEIQVNGELTVLPIIRIGKRVIVPISEIEKILGTPITLAHQLKAVAS